MRIVLLLVSLFIFSSCGGTPTQESSTRTPALSPQGSEIKTPKELRMRADTPTRGDNGDFFIRGEIEAGEVNVGDTIDIAEKGGRSISILVKSIMDSVGENPKAEKGQMVSIYFDGDASLYESISTDSYLVEKGGRYPEALSNQGTLQTEERILKGKVNGGDWEGKSIINPPPYYKFGSRAMLSPDIPLFKMSFGRESDNSSVNFDLKGGLKVGTYTKDALEINYSDNTGTNIYSASDTLSNVTVEVTSYVESENRATISGKITGNIVTENRGTTTLDLEWKDILIDVWGEEAK